MTNKPYVTIWTDGSAIPKNPHGAKYVGNGGWAAVLIYGDTVKAIYGCLANTSVNYAETFGALSALKALRRQCRVTIYTDSQYLVSGIDALMNGRILKTHQPLWRDFLPMLRLHYVTTEHVSGHSMYLWNELADALASRGTKERRSGTILLSEVQEESEDGLLLKKLQRRVDGRQKRAETMAQPERTAGYYPR